jgi:transcriptional regulator
MTKTKNKGGRPEIVLTDEQIKEVELKAESLTCEQIADHFGFCHITFKEIRNRQPEVSFAYKRGRAKVINEIASSLISKAREGDTTSQIFYLKTQAGWSEKQVIETHNKTPQKRFILEADSGTAQD